MSRSQSGFVLVAVVFLSGIVLSGAMAQDQMQDVVYLKNGGIVRGIIIEQVPGKSIKIQTKDGNVFVYTMGEVERMTKETNTQAKPQSSMNQMSSNSGVLSINPLGFAVGGISWLAYEGSIGSSMSWQARLHYVGYTYKESETSYNYDEKGSGFGGGFGVRGYIGGSQPLSGLFGAFGLDFVSVKWDWTEIDGSQRYAGSGSTGAFGVSSQVGYSLALSNVRLEPSIVVGYFAGSSGSKQFGGVFFSPALDIGVLF